MRKVVLKLLDFAAIAVIVSAIPFLGNAVAQSAVVNALRLKLISQTYTVNSNDVGTPASFTLTPVRSDVVFICNDPDGCTGSIGGTGIADGTVVSIHTQPAAGTYPITINSSSSACLKDSVVLGDITDTSNRAYSATFRYDASGGVSCWVEVAHKASDEPIQKIKTIHQTDAQIKAWPTTANVEIVPAVTGYAQVPLWAALVCDSTSGNYTNIDTTVAAGASITITTNNNSSYGLSYILESGSPVLGKVSDLLAVSGLQMVVLGSNGAIDTAESGSTWGNVLAIPFPAAVYNGNIVLTVANGTSGDFTGGSGSNAGCDITVSYLKYKIPGLP